MLGSTVKEFVRATPFVPFVLQMNDRRRFTIEHPDYISVSPRGGKLIVYDAEENETHLSGLLVAPVEPVKRRKARSWRACFVNPPRAPTLAKADVLTADH